LIIADDIDHQQRDAVMRFYFINGFIRHKHSKVGTSLRGAGAVSLILTSKV
jgi:hypothetical protein